MSIQTVWSHSHGCSFYCCNENSRTLSHF
ncbi:MAG: hypothetical protein DME98_07075 [Verrucomicrobia bacterium]|nr:MAG: hypothetical protein DME98_07075 [Verrucomicrobiota bacterium]